MCSPYIISETDDFYPLSVLFHESGLEIPIGDTPPANTLKVWRANDAASGALIGGAILQIRNGVYTLADIAVVKNRQKQGLGKILQQHVFDEAKARGATELWCTAKVPEYYEHCGWERIEWNKAAKVAINCDTCKKRNISCFPEILRIRLS